MMRNIAVIVDGVWMQPQFNDDHRAVSARNDSNVANSSTCEVDQIVSLLGQVIRRAQSLSDQDQRRVRDFVQATQSMLTATTYLPKSDQATFEAALRSSWNG
jgi:hypothetical protein